MKPLYMWAGGKTKMLKHYGNLADLSGETYVEPFFGGGAMFGHVHDRFSTSVINDLNYEIMGVWRSVQLSPNEFIEGTSELFREYLAIQAHPLRKEWYYAKRAEYWETPTSHLLYVLMRLGFNGIWQTCKDSRGLFGTPAGLLNQTRLSQLADPGRILEWSQALQNTTIASVDYKQLEFSPRGATIFIDPPYRGSFTKYGTVFGDAEQEAVALWAKSLAAQGAKVLFANRQVEADTFFENLLPEFEFHYFPVTYTAGRRKVTETGFEAKKAVEFLAVASSAA